MRLNSLESDDLIELAGLLFGDPSSIRDAGLLAAAAARPQASVFGVDAYPDNLDPGHRPTSVDCR